MFYNENTGKQMTRKALCKELNASIPEGVAQVGNWFKLDYAPRPAATSTQKVVTGEIKFVDGKYMQMYRLEPKTDAELNAERFIKEEEVRAERNEKLAATDYMVMADYPMDEATREMLLEYRQALRDIPEQAGFPFEVEWPTFVNSTLS